MTTTPKSRCVITVSRNFISLKSSEYLILICRDRDANESSLPVTNVEHDNIKRPQFTPEKLPQTVETVNHFHRSKKNQEEQDKRNRSQNNDKEQKHQKPQ